MKKLCLALFAVCLVSLQVALAQDPEFPLTGEPVNGWELVSLQPLAGWLYESAFSTTTATLSPDASRVAWVDDETDAAICIAELGQTVTTHCYPSTDEFLMIGSIPRLLWSPDSRYLAFSDTNLRMLDEGDLWVMDTTSGTIENLTPDGVFGKMFDPQGDGEMLIDLSPMWSPDGSLYFIRALKGEVGYPSKLYRFSRATVAGIEVWGDLTLVTDFEPTLGANIPVYEYPVAAFDGPMAFSPDGAWLALAITPILAEDRDKEGISLVNIATGEMTQLVQIDELLPLGLPKEIDAADLQDFAISGVGWTGDGSTMLATLVNPNFGPIFSIQTYQIDLASRSVMPLFDWTELTSVGFYNQTRDDNTAPIYDVSMYTVVISNTVLLRNYQPFGFSAIDLTNPSELPIRLTDPKGLGEFPPSRAAFSSVGSDGVNLYVLLDGQLLTFAPIDSE